MIRFNTINAQKEKIDVILNEWNEIKSCIQVSFNQRNKEVYKEMQDGISLYQKLLRQVSEASNCQDQILEDFEVLPLNGNDRYQFITNNPSLYVAFRQLDELFEETKKKIARLRITNQ